MRYYTFLAPKIKIRMRIVEIILFAKGALQVFGTRSQSYVRHDQRGISEMTVGL